MNVITEDIKDFLVSKTNLVFKTSLFVGREPTSPDNVTTIYDQSGSGPQLTNDKKTDDTEGDDYEYSALHIRCRDNDYLDAMAQANEIVGVLHGRKETINGTSYELIEAIDSPALLKWDDNNRAIVIVNFAIQRKTV